MPMSLNDEEMWRDRSDPERRGDDVHPAGSQSAPEIDINSAASALGLLIAALLVMRGRRDAMD